MEKVYRDLNNNYKRQVVYESVKIPLTLFNEGPLGIVPVNEKKGIVYGSEITQVKPFINAVDIDWNDAVISTDERLKTTSDLINWIEGTYTKINTLISILLKKDMLSLEELKELNNYIVIPVEKIKINPTNYLLEIGETRLIEPIITPNNATNKTVNWRSTNRNVVTVDENGLVTAHSAGNCSIVCSSTDGSNKKYIIFIWVYDPSNLNSDSSDDESDSLNESSSDDTLNNDSSGDSMD